MARHLICPLVLLAMALGLGACADAGGGQGDLYIAPFLQSPSAGAVTVVWVSRTERNVALEAGPAAGKLLAVPVVCRPLPAATPSAESKETTTPAKPFYHCSARLTDLVPGQLYRYRVRAGDASAEETFFVPDPGARSFSFIVYGDSRDSPSRHRRVAQAIARARSDFVLHTGDLVSADAIDQYREQFFSPLQDVIGRRAIWLVRGNHEGRATVYRDLFDLPGNELWYSFDYGNVHFAVLDSCRGGQEMLDWLDADLAGAGRAAWKIVVTHHPPYDLGQSPDRWGREQFVPLFERHGVDLVLSGHSHNYQRFRPLWSGPAGRSHPITYLVTGGGGAPTHRLGDSPHLAAGSRELHLVQFDAADRVLTGRTLTAEGRLIDTFRLAKDGDGNPDPEYVRQAMSAADFDRLPRVQGPYFGRPYVRELPVRDREWTAFLSLAVGPADMRYRISLAPDCRENYQSEPVSGTVTANGAKLVSLAVRVQGNVKVHVDEDGLLFPPLEFSVEYSFGGGRTVVRSGRVKFSPGGD